MTLDRLREMTCEFFEITQDDFMSSDRGKEEVSIARHCFRHYAYQTMGRPKSSIARYEGKTHASIINSCRTILDGVFDNEYNKFKQFIAGQTVKNISIVRDESGIERVTNEAFDERFYKHPTRINDRTGLPYFPAFHFLTQEGEPTPYGLIEWYKQQGYNSNQIVARSQLIGSFVHDCCDRMTKSDSVVTHEDIHLAFPDAKEAQRVKDCLYGFINFVMDEEPVFLAAEKMECGDDFGFTIDTKLLLKSDKYKNVWAGDYKTSKSATEGHRMQVEAMRRVLGCNRGVVIVLGNSTKKKYTLTKIPVAKHDYYWDRFLAIKETAYVELIERNQIQPRVDNMPSEFSLKDIKFKRKL